MQISSLSHLAISSTVQASAHNHTDTLTRCTTEGPAVEAGGPQCQRYRQAAVISAVSCRQLPSAAATIPSTKLPPGPYGLYCILVAYLCDSVVVMNQQSSL